MCNILLTGSSGFVGSYFIKHFGNKHHITTFSFLEGDIDSLVLSPVDTVVHLSALVHQMQGADETLYEEVNVNQTMALAGKAKASGVKHFIFMSTVKVYGEESDMVYREESECHPEDAYGKSKLRAEKKLRALENDTFTVSIVRSPVVYGRGVKANISNLVTLVKKIPLLPLGSIKNKRTMVYVGNLSAIIDRIITTKKSGIFLAADDRNVSTSELIMLIAGAVGRHVTLVSVPFFPALVRFLKPKIYKRLYKSLQLDNSLTKKRLGYTNPFSTESGIQHMVNQKESSSAGK